MIKIEGLCKRYGDKEILKDIVMDVEKGEVFVIIGPTGAGKTTLLRLIHLLEKPTSGTIYFQGSDTDAPENVRLGIRRRMAIVFQKPTVFNASVYDNVAYGLKIRGESRASLHSEVTRALETVGLSGYEGRNARILSGGEVQRVVLARAIVTKPEVLLLDEPTANLDPVSTAHIEKLITSIIQESATTVIMATHDMFQGQRLADRMGVLIDGQILQTGDPREVFYLPQSREIAEFVGVENILEGVVASNEEGMVTVDMGAGVIEALSNIATGVGVSACIRSEEVALALAKPSTSARNCFPGKIIRVALAGPLARIEIDCGFPLVALITKRSAEEMDLRSGKEIYASFKATGVHIIKRQPADNRRSC